jgi:selenocysteine-specific elongation factor
VGVCVTQLDPGLMERGLAAAPDTVPTFNCAIASAEKIRFFSGRVSSGSKLHVSVGHDTVMAEVTAFGMPDGKATLTPQVDMTRQFLCPHLSDCASSFQGQGSHRIRPCGP